MRHKFTGNYAQRNSDPERCAAAVHEGGRSVGFRQCSNARKPGTEWCGVHSDAAEDRRKENADDRHAKWRAQRIETGEQRRRDAARLASWEALVEALEGYVDLLDRVHKVTEKHLIPPGRCEKETINLLFSMTDNSSVVGMMRKARAALAIAKECKG